MHILITTIKDAHIRNAHTFARTHAAQMQTSIVSQPDALIETAKATNPDFIFFPHWSWIIPKEVYEKYTCIVFHTANLPHGRGGSPIQNQISRGIMDSSLCAIGVAERIDAGPIYLKTPISLLGTADEILIRTSEMIFSHMIPRIIFERPAPEPQQGTPIIYKRRTPGQSRITADMSLSQLFHHIQMLDGDGYPHAFIEADGFRLTFSRASQKSDGVIADVRIERIDDQ